MNIATYICVYISCHDGYIFLNSVVGEVRVTIYGTDSPYILLTNFPVVNVPCELLILALCNSCCLELIDMYLLRYAIEYKWLCYVST